MVFDPGLATTFSFLGSSGWADADTYVARYTILDGNVTVDDDDVQVSAARDLALNVQIPSSLNDDLDVDTENPIISGFTVTGGQVGTKDGNDCVREVTFTATVTDPNGVMDPDDILITSATVRTANASITASLRGHADILQSDMLRSSPGRSTSTISRAARRLLESFSMRRTSSATRPQQAWAEDDVYDTIVPTINDFTFNTDGTYATPTDEYEVDACCVTTVYFSANVTDNCCIAEGNIGVVVSLPTQNAVLENVWWDATQAGQKRVDVIGHADVRCLYIVLRARRG